MTYLWSGICFSSISPGFNVFPAWRSKLMTEDFVTCTEGKLNHFSLCVSLTYMHRESQKNNSQYSAQQALLIASSRRSLFSQGMVDGVGIKATMITEVFLLKVRSRRVREKQRSQEITFSSPVANVNLLWKAKKKEERKWHFDSSHITSAPCFTFCIQRFDQKGLTVALKRHTFGKVQ